MSNDKYTKDYFYSLLSFTDKSLIYKTPKEFTVLTLEANNTISLINTNNPDRYYSDRPFKVFETDELRQRINN